MLDIENLSIHYSTNRGTIRAVEKVSFDVNPGEIIGIVGESGCGKSTLLQAIQRVLPPNGTVAKGSVEFENTNILDLDEDQFRRDYSLKQISTIPQAAMDSLDPVYTVRKQLQESMRVHLDGISKQEMNQRIEERTENMGLDSSVLDKYQHELSGGQLQRVLIINSFLLEPKIVLADEPTTGLDLLTKTRILKWLKDLQRDRGFSLILVSHDLPLIAQMSDKLGVMYAGKLVEFGPAGEVFRNPSHPYSMGLIESTMHVDKDRESGHIPGSPPTLIGDMEGCNFENRCPYSFDECGKTPELRYRKNHHVACHLDEDEIVEARERAHIEYRKH